MFLYMRKENYKRHMIKEIIKGDLNTVEQLYMCLFTYKSLCRQYVVGWESEDKILLFLKMLSLKVKNLYVSLDFQ